MRVVLLALAVCWGFSVVLACPADKAAGQEQGTSQPEGGKQGNKKDELDKKTKGDAIRLSQVIGMNARNSQCKKLGEITDAMLDTGASARVRYAVLSFGGFAGIGNKLFAIPWPAIKFGHDADRDQNYVLFDVTEESLKSTPGLDKDHWPNLGNRRWMREVDEYHNIDTQGGTPDVYVLPQARDPATAALLRAQHDFRLHRGSEVLGMTIKNAVGDKLGNVEDIVVDMKSGDISYLAMSFGGFLGIGDKLLAVPWEAVSVQYDLEQKEYFVLFDVTKDQLNQADGFDKDDWPESGNDDWTLASHEKFKADDNSADKKSK